MSNIKLKQQHYSSNFGLALQHPVIMMVHRVCSLHLFRILCGMHLHRLYWLYWARNDKVCTHALFMLELLSNAYIMWVSTNWLCMQLPTTIHCTLFRSSGIIYRKTMLRNPKQSSIHFGSICTTAFHGTIKDQHHATWVHLKEHNINQFVRA